MIRLAGIKFDKVVKHSSRLGSGRDLTGREDSTLEADVHYFGEDSHNCLEALVRDQKEENG
eukprot:4914289-Prymnesium_polylepis.1